MLQLHLESTENSRIYRKIHIAAELNFFDLDFAISLAFDLMDNAGMVFTVLRSDGEEAKGIEIAYVSEDEEQLDSDKEYLEDWFSQLGDEVLCRIEGNKYELKIKLEQFVEQANFMDGTICTEGQGSLKSNRQKKVNLEEINMALSMQDSVFDALLNSPDSNLPPDYLSLFEVSDELKKMKPWQYFENEEIIALYFEEHDATFLVSVMGAAGQEFGLMIYDDDLGFTALSKILSGKPLSEDFRYDLNALVIGFADRNELEEADYELIKSHGLSYRGKKNWIHFRSYEEGTYPIIPLYSDVEMMIEIAAAIIKVTALCKTGWQYPKLNEYTFAAFQVFEDGEISEMYALEKSPNNPNQPLLIEINDIEKMHYKRKPKHTVQIELDMFYLPFPIKEQEDERPIYPLVFAVMDKTIGEVISHDIIPFPKLTINCQEIFWGYLNEFPVKPSKVFVSKDMKGHLEAVAKVLGIELVESEIPGIHELKEMMKMMPPFE
ncbi:MAG: hypothetical protein RR588_00910 [Solibacillus sp.]